MKLYYQVNVFNAKGEFISDEILQVINKNRKRFFIFFPRECRLTEVIAFQKFLAQHKNLSFCIHDKNQLVPDNELNVGRNVAFYTMLSHAGANIENISFHMGSLIGFGTNRNDRHIDSLLQYSLPEKMHNQRFLIADFTPDQYLKSYYRAVDCIKNIAAIFKETKLQFLLKNFSVDTIIVSQDKKQYFTDLNYIPSSTNNNNIYSFPFVLEKGDFPRTSNEILAILETCQINLSLDMEHLQNTILFSQKYNIQNETLLQEWRIPHFTPEQKEFIQRYGFFLQKGYPILYQKPLDLYELIEQLQNKIEITHLTGSLGPVFLDKYNLTEEDITPEVLMGQLDEKDIPYATLGKEQQIQFSPIEHTGVHLSDNFKNHAAQKLWQHLFSRQFLENILILKEIKCKRIIQKIKSLSETSIETYELFNKISELDIEP